MEVVSFASAAGTWDGSGFSCGKRQECREHGKPLKHMFTICSR